MNNNEPAAEHYSINGFKYFSELAKEYFPDLANASSASKKNAQTHQSRQDVERTTGCRVLHLPNNRHQSRNATNPLPPLGTSPHRPADQRLIT